MDIYANQVNCQQYTPPYAQSLLAILGMQNVISHQQQTLLAQHDNSVAQEMINANLANKSTWFSQAAREPVTLASVRERFKKIEARIIAIEAHVTTAAFRIDLELKAA